MRKNFDGLPRLVQSELKRDVKKFGKPIGCAYICNRMAAETKSIRDKSWFGWDA
jgi:hypothetical protein